jgi:hypothetical protein
MTKSGLQEKFSLLGKMRQVYVAALHRLSSFSSPFFRIKILKQLLIAPVKLSRSSSFYYNYGSWMTIGPGGHSNTESIVMNNREMKNHERKMFLWIPIILYMIYYTYALE